MTLQLLRLRLHVLKIHLPKLCVLDLELPRAVAPKLSPGNPTHAKAHLAIANPAEAPIAKGNRSSGICV